ncbi:MAG: 30S ribosomal protein S2 [Deltaproteobacteria bacterium]|jgi:small subunit ribosomal protein S2|nr:30S ribosomal protein S2 [Deltaproteobacteria bacterium]
MTKEVVVREMLEAGVHFGHQTRRWNPKMRPYIFAARDGIHIIDLDQTAKQAQKAYKFIADTVALGNIILFVGTKKQAKDVIEQEAKRVGQYYVSNRWLGGMLTNFRTIRQSIDRLNTLEEKKEKGELDKLTKKEALRIDREIAKLEFSLGGIKSMTKLPGAIFIVDPNKEDIAKLEARKLKIPVIALTDTNSNPDGIDYLIAGNDDAIRSIQYFSKLAADACEDGAKRREIVLREQAAKQEKEQTEKPKGPAVREKKMGGKGRAWVARRGGDEGVSNKEAEQYSKASAEPTPEVPATEKKEVIQ